MQSDIAALYRSHAERGRNAWWRYVLALAAAALIATLATMLLSIALAAAFKMPLNALADALNHPANPRIFFAGFAAVFASLLLGLAVAVAALQRKRPSDLIGTWQWRPFFFCMGFWILVQLLLALIDFAIRPSGFHLAASAGSLTLAAWALPAVLIQTFTEEFIFRGYLTQAALLLLKRPLFAACLSGLLFGAMHIPNGTPQAINALVFGIVCAWIAMRSGSIALTSGIHLANNYFGAVVLVSANDVFRGSPGLITQNTPDLQWWDLGLAVLAMALAPWALTRLRLLPPRA